MGLSAVFDRNRARGGHRHHRPFIALVCCRWILLVGLSGLLHHVCCLGFHHDGNTEVPGESFRSASEPTAKPEDNHAGAFLHRPPRPGLDHLRRYHGKNRQTGTFIRVIRTIGCPDLPSSARVRRLDDGPHPSPFAGHRFVQKDNAGETATWRIVFKNNPPCH